MGEDTGEEWVDKTTPFQRVRSVIIDEEQPRSVAWIADEAVVTVEECREAVETLRRAGVIRDVPGVGDADVFESIPDTRLAATKRALRDEYTDEELRELLDELAVEVKIGERTDGDAEYRLMVLKSCIRDINAGR